MSYKRLSTKSQATIVRNNILYLQNKLSESATLGRTDMLDLYSEQIYDAERELQELEQKQKEENYGK